MHYCPQRSRKRQSGTENTFSLRNTARVRWHTSDCQTFRGGNNRWNRDRDRRRTSWRAQLHIGKRERERMESAMPSEHCVKYSRVNTTEKHGYILPPFYLLFTCGQCHHMFDVFFLLLKDNKNELISFYINKYNHIYQIYSPPNILYIYIYIRSDPTDKLL